MINIKEVLERLSNGADDVICREYELRPQIIAELIENVAKITKEYGYVLIGVEKKGNGYNIIGIDAMIDIEHIVNLALQRIALYLQAEYIVHSLEGKRICVIGVGCYVDNEVKNVTQEEVFNDLFNACIKLQKNTTFINVSEDQRNDFVRDILETRGYQVKDQTRQGKSASGISSGEVDILIHQDGNPISIIEALNLNGFEKAYLDEHIEKVYKYDITGNKINYLISYVKTKNFGKFWEKYVVHIRNYGYPYNLVARHDKVEKEYDYTDIRYICTIHNRNGKKTTLIHICLKIME